MTLETKTTVTRMEKKVKDLDVNEQRCLLEAAKDLLIYKQEYEAASHLRSVLNWSCDEGKRSAWSVEVKEVAGSNVQDSADVSGDSSCSHVQISDSTGRRYSCPVEEDQIEALIALLDAWILKRRPGIWILNDAVVPIGREETITHYKELVEFLRKQTTTPADAYGISGALFMLKRVQANRDRAEKFIAHCAENMERDEVLDKSSAPSGFQSHGRFSCDHVAENRYELRGNGTLVGSGPSAGKAWSDYLEWSKSAPRELTAESTGESSGAFHGLEKDKCE